MIPQQALELANNLTRLTKEFVSTDPQQAADIKRAFKEKSKNDLVRTVVYLLEVVGSKDFESKQVKQENTDLKELLKLNNIDVEKVANDDTDTENQEAKTALGGDENISSVGGDEVIASSGLGNINSEAASQA